MLPVLLVRHGFPGLGPGPAAGDAAGHVRVDEDAEGLLLPKDIVRAAAHDDAAGAARHLPDDLLLGMEDLSGLLDGLGVQVHEAAAHGDGEELPGTAFHHLPHILLGKGGVLGDGGQDLLVIVVVAKLPGKTAAQLPAPAAELPADGDDLVQFRSPLRRGGSAACKMAMLRNPGILAQFFPEFNSREEQIRRAGRANPQGVSGEERLTQPAVSVK